MITKKAVYSQTAFFHLDQRKFLQPPEDHYCIYVSTAFERIKPGQKNYPFQLFLLAAFPYLCRPKSVFADSFGTMLNVHWDKPAFAKAMADKSN